MKPPLYPCCITILPAAGESLYPTYMHSLVTAY